MKKLFLFSVSILIFLLSCSMGSDTGSLTLNLTDAPVRQDGLESVFITFTQIDANLPGSGGWQTLASFEDENDGHGRTVDLMTLTEGKTIPLAEDVELPSGRVNQIRFALNAPEEGGDGSNPGCYLLYSDGTKVPLYIPSGTSTGFKAVNSFTVPVNGDVTVTADFDARKSLVDSGDVVKLRPTIRLIVDDEAGRINGTVTTDGTYGNYTVFAYEEGDYDASEVSPDADGIRFAGSVASSLVNDEGSYVLAFLAEGSYDLIVAGNDDGSDPVYVDAVYSVAVESGKGTHQDIDTTD